MTRQFTFILSGGCVASFAIGLIMDHAGVEAATCATLLLGMSHELILIFLSTSKWWMNVGFIFYICFRQFMFPVSIALITSRLGFKFFGLLNGIAFLLSGVAQLFMVPLVNEVKGTCHNYNSQDQALIIDACDHGNWIELHVVEFIVFAVLLLVPFFDNREKRAHQKRVKEMAELRSSWRMLYGGSTVSTSPLMGRTFSSGSYGSTSPAASYRGAAMRDELDVLDEYDEDEGLHF